MMDRRLVFGFVVLLLVVRLARASSISGTISPLTPSAFTNRDLTLKCTLGGNIADDISAQDIFFEYTNPDVWLKAVSKVVDNLTVSLTIPKVYLNMSSSKISCHLGNSTLDEVAIVINELRFPNETKCVVHNWERMVCTWEWEEVDNISISMAYSRSYGKQWYECPIPGVKSCTWESSAKDKNQFFEASYAVMLYTKRNGNAHEFLSETEKTYDSKRIVKPGQVPVTQQAIGTDHITLSFAHTTRRTVRTRVAYESRFSKMQIQTTTDRSITLSNLIPNTNYTITFDCIPLVDGKVSGFWSDNHTVHIKTKSDVPGASPSVSPGGFLVLDGTASPHRGIKLFFKPVDDILAHGEVRGYRVNITTNNSTSDLEISNLATNAILELEMEEAYNVSVEMRNAAGYNESLAPTVIVIGKKSEMPLFPDNFVVQTDNQGTYFFNWTSVDQASSYTLYWCTSDIRQFECKHPLHWKVLPSTQTSEVMKVVEQHGFTVRFAISVERNETLSSGMWIANCTYKRNGELKPPEGVKFIRETPNAVRVVFEKRQCDQTTHSSDRTAYASQYAIEYCPVNPCEKKERVWVDSFRDSVMIDGLDADKVYEFHIRSVSETGLSSVAEPIESALGSQQEQSFPVGVVVGVSVLVVATCCIPLFVKLHGWVKKKWHIDVRTPPKYPTEIQAKSADTTNYSSFLRIDLDSSGQVQTTVWEPSHKESSHCYFNSASFPPPSESDNLLPRPNSQYKSSTSSSEMSDMPSSQSSSASSDPRRNSVTSASISGYNVVIEQPGETSGSFGGSRTSGPCDEGAIATTEIC